MTSTTTIRRCSYCEHDKPACGFHGARCADCKRERHKARTPEQRAEERRRAAERSGKVYVPGGLVARRAFNKAQRMNAHVAAYRKATDKAAKRAEQIAAKPWTAPELSEAEAYRMRYRLDAEFQIKERVRRQLNKRRKGDDVADMVRAALKRDGNSPTAERLLGYSLTDLRGHLERQFTKGMTWARFLAGEIHIDHITPQAAFDLSKPAEWVQCWALPNLRPLWAKENRQKGARIECLA